MRISFLFLFSFVFLAVRFLAAEPAPSDSVSLSLTDADQLFLQKNFSLLAAHYNVSAAEAGIIQAKLYPNPNLSIEQGAYNPGNKKWFESGASGEAAASLQQLIILARKRNKQINLAKINSSIATFNFYDLARTLRYELHTSFYRLHFLRQSLVVYDKELESLSSLISAYTDQYNKGNVSFRELARLQALQFNLQNERLDVLKELSEKQSALILLTGDTLARPVRPVLITGNVQPDPSRLIFTQLVDSAFANRYDLLAATAHVQFDRENLALQKALRLPDLTLGANWDRQGSYIYNYNSISLAVDLPFWNRNQGNIRSAENQAKASEMQEQQARLQVRNEVSSAFTLLLETDRLYKSAASGFTADYEKLLDGINKSYASHTISLLEFIDYYETYKDSQTEYNRLQNNRLDAIENLDLATGTIVFK